MSLSNDELKKFWDIAKLTPIAGSDITTAAEVIQTRCQRYRSWRRKKVFSGSLFCHVKIANLDMQGLLDVVA